MAGLHLAGLAGADIVAPDGEPHAPGSPALALAPAAGHAPAAPERVRVRVARRHPGARWARLRAALARWVEVASEGIWGWVYRVSMVAIAAALVWALWRIQEVTGTGGTVVYTGAWWHKGLRWLELLWLAPAPLAAALWAGWLVWAEAARREPAPRPAPQVAVLVDGPAVARMPARLVFRFVTRGEQVEALQASLEAARAAMRAMPPAPGAPSRAGAVTAYRIEIVSDRSLPSLAAPDCAVYAIPADYQTVARSRFKARALTYLQGASPATGDEWRLYLDEESRVDPSVVAGIYDFIERAEREAAHGGPEARRRIGQGAMLYEGGPAFFRAADALRTGDDLGRFRLQYGLGAPVFGAHGSFLLVRGMDEPSLSFDVGARNSITEDAAWALQAWGCGWRFGWIAGYVREQPPQSVMDFVRQRARWLTGVRLVALDRAVPLGCRIILLLFVALWQLSFVPLLVTLVALATHTPPIAWMRLPADITWATFMLAYLQGLDTQAARAARKRAWPGPARLRPLWLVWARVREWTLALGIFWYSLLEMFAVIYSLRREVNFHVIRKPRVTEPIGARDNAARTPLSADERRAGAHA
ncbi:MAG TPA: glycosyltransferase family 2 protein [Ktedonobacterales bacterium]|nr:glycosyltransferase family 2 protein [Ktedonobacterales bacterium]